MTSTPVPDLETHPKDLTPAQREWLKKSRDVYVAFYLTRWERVLLKAGKPAKSKVTQT